MTETLIKILLFGTFSCVLLSLAIEDHRHNRLPNRLTIPLILTGLLLNWTDTINQFGFHYISFQDSALGAALGYAGVRALHEIQLYRSGRTGIGLGDAKFLAALGAWFGWQSLPVLLVGGFADHVKLYITEDERQAIWSRPQHNLPRYSGHTYVRQWIEFIYWRSLYELRGVADRQMPVNLSCIFDLITA